MAIRSQSAWLLAAGVLSLLAGIRDWIAPGFFSISRHHHSDTIDITVELLAGAIFILLAIRKSTHPQRT